MTTSLSESNEQTLAGNALRMSRRQWHRLLDELRRRGGGSRESGAFLLAEADGHRVKRIAYYDDLDAECLTGGISFASAGFTELWRICREENLRLVADVHTHPGTWVRQSHIDATNPMYSRAGHVALIVPHYGAARRVEECGVHVYLGSRRWHEVPVNERGSVVDVSWSFVRDWLRSVSAWFRRAAQRGVAK